MYTISHRALRIENKHKFWKTKAVAWARNEWVYMKHMETWYQHQSVYVFDFTRLFGQTWLIIFSMFLKHF